MTTAAVDEVQALIDSFSAACERQGNAERVEEAQRAARYSQEWIEKRRGLPMQLDEEHAVMTREVFEKLDNYTHTLPTGTYANKIWRREDLGLPGVWYLGEYVDVDDPEKIGIKWRAIVVVGP